jgi:hypothetical protein
MKKLHALSATIALMSTLVLVAPPLFAQKERPKTFADMAAEMPEGKLPKERVMAMLEKTFDKADTRQEKKLDVQQARQFQFFLRVFTRDSGM